MDYLQSILADFWPVIAGALLFLALKFITDKGYLTNKYSIIIDEDVEGLDSGVQAETRKETAKHFAYGKLYEYAVQSGTLKLDMDENVMLESAGALAFSGSKIHRYAEPTMHSAVIIADEHARKHFAYLTSGCSRTGALLLLGSCIGSIRVIE